MPLNPVVARIEGGIPMVFPYAVCMVQDQHYYLRGVMGKYLSWLRLDTQPAPHDHALNCVSVHRYPGCQILSHQLFSGWGTCRRILSADKICDTSERTPDRNPEIRAANWDLTWCQLDAYDHMTSCDWLVSDIYRGIPPEGGYAFFFEFLLMFQPGAEAQPACSVLSRYLAAT